jgi:hypothetical protein
MLSADRHEVTAAQALLLLTLLVQPLVLLPALQSLP